MIPGSGSYHTTPGFGLSRFQEVVFRRHFWCILLGGRRLFLSPFPFFFTPDPGQLFPYFPWDGALHRQHDTARLPMLVGREPMHLGELFVDQLLLDEINEWRRQCMAACTAPNDSWFVPMADRLRGRRLLGRSQKVIGDGKV